MTTKHKLQTHEKFSLISGYELIRDTKEFLDENYPGCYLSHPVDYVTRSIFVSVDGYAKFLKIIFKAVFASHLINIKIKSDSKCLIYDIEFDSHMLTDSNIDDLVGIANESGFSIDINENRIRVKFDFISSAFTVFQAISTRIVYNSLKKVFLS